MANIEPGTRHRTAAAEDTRRRRTGQILYVPSSKVMGSCWAYTSKGAFTRPGNGDIRWTWGFWGKPDGWANHLNYEGRICWMGDGSARYIQESRLTRAHFAVGPDAGKITPK